MSTTLGSCDRCGRPLPPGSEDPASGIILCPGGCKPRKPSTLAVLHEVLAERLRQDDRWGEQNHPNGTGCGARMGPIDLQASAAAWEDYARAQLGRTVSYAAILLEEVAEALQEGDPERLRDELVQVAAVAVAWVEKIDRDFSVGEED